MKHSKNFLNRLICVLCVMGILMPPRPLSASRSLQGDAFKSLKQMLHDPYVFDADADPILLKSFKEFHLSVDDKWFGQGLRTKTRQLRQNYSPMNAELFSMIVERSHAALELRNSLEISVNRWGRYSQKSFGTVARYMSDVWLPMINIQAEGRIFPELKALQLQAALWPNFEFNEEDSNSLIDLSSLQLRTPAAEAEAGASADDANDFLNMVSPLLDQKLLSYAEVLRESAQRTQKIAQIQKEIAELKNKEVKVFGRGRRPDKAAIQKAALANAETQKRIAALEQELRRMTSLERRDEINKERSKLIADSIHYPQGMNKSEPIFKADAETIAKINELDKERLFLKSPEDQQKMVVEFFAEAAKLTTLNLMLKQIHFYQDISNVSRSLDMKSVAPACLASYKELPPTLNFSLSTQEERLFNMEMFLSHNGLLFSESESIKEDDFQNFFLSFESRDPFKGYYSGTMPFHRLRIAQQGKLYTMGQSPQISELDASKNSNLNWKNLGLPEFHDVHDFADVLEFMIPEASKHLTQEDSEEFQKIISLIPAPFQEVEETSEHYLDFLEAQKWIGLTPYLRDKLIELGKNRENWVHAIPKEVLMQFTQNKIKIDFPSFFGSEAYKQWALRLLYRVLSKEKSIAAVEELCKSTSINVSDSASPFEKQNIARLDSKTCASSATKEGLRNQLLAKLRPFEDSGPFVPPSLSYSQGLSANWSDLRVLWRHFREAGEFDELEGEQGPVFDEFTFIKTQFGMNPWVMLRISVMAKLWDLENTSLESELKSTKKIKRSQLQTDSKVSKARSKKLRLIKALKALPLSDPKVAVRPAYGNVLYSKHDLGWKSWKKEEKVYYKLWDNIEKKFHDNNAHVFKSQSAKSIDYYGVFEKLETKSLLEEKDVESFVKEHSLDRQNVDPSEMRELLEIAKTSHDSEKFELIKKIMQSPGEVENHQKLLEDYLFRQGYEDDFDDPQDVKLSFFRRDANYKFPIMTQIMKNASMKRAKELEVNMNPLCELDSSDEKQWDKLMSMTGETQKMFNNAFGMEAIPDEVLKFYDRGGDGPLGMDSRDAKNMGWMVVGFIGLALATAGSGALCASGVASVVGCPLTVTMATAISLTSLGYSASGFILKATEEAMGREERMRLGKTFESLGFSNKESVEKVKGAGWGWVVFEVVTAATMFVPIGLASKLLGKNTLNLLVKREASKAGLNGLESSLTIFETMEAKAAEEVLGLATKATKSSSIISRFFTQVKAISNPAQHWRAIKKEFAEGFIVNHTPEVLNQKTGEALAKYFEGNKKAFSNFVQRNVRLKLERVEKIIARSPKSDHPKQLAKLTKYFRGMHLKPDRLGQFQAEILKEKEFVAKLVKELSEAEGPELASIIAKNAELLAPLLSDFTFHWWRLPSYAFYEVLFHGAPWDFTNKFLMRAITNRAAVKHIFASREKLMVHYLRRQAQEGIGLHSKVAVFNQVAMFQTAENLVMRTAVQFIERQDATLKGAGEKALRDWAVFKEEIAKKVLEANAQSGLDVREVERLLFQSTAKETEKARLLLKKVKLEELFQHVDFGNNMDMVLTQLSRETRNLDSLSEYVALMSQRVKMLSLPMKRHEVISF